MKTRTDIINFIAKASSAQSYLEIGVATKQNFDNIICKNKYCVDINPTYSPNFVGPSDAFFKIHKKSIKFDLIFIDALHEHYALMRDIRNSIKILNEGGYIVCHDISPVSKESQTTPNKGSGTCWKGWVHMRMQESNLFMFALDIDHGCGVISKGCQNTIKNVALSDLNYENLQKNKEDWLNLVSVEDFKNNIIKGKFR